MTRLIFRRLTPVIVIVCCSILCFAQPARSAVDEPKPYKILTSGKQVTVKSAKNIKTVMVWTASGHRIIEQQEINATSYSFNVNINEKYFFVMILLEGSKSPFTEKMGVD
jgi:hypothetical protein